MPLEYHILLSMSLYQLETEYKHHCMFLSKCILIKAVTTLIVWHGSTCDGLSAALIPSPLGKRYNHCYTSAGRLKCAKPQIKSYFSKVKFQNLLHYYKSKGKQKWWIPQTHARQSKVSKQQSKISVCNLTLWKYFQTFLILLFYFHKLFSDQPGTHGLACYFPSGFQEQAIVPSQMLSLNFIS